MPYIPGLGGYISLLISITLVSCFQITNLVNSCLVLQQTTLLHGANPSWSLVMTCIALFVLQYTASGVLEQRLLQHELLGLPVQDLLLSTTAVAHWYTFDRSSTGTSAVAYCW